MNTFLDTSTTTTLHLAIKGTRLEGAQVIVFAHKIRFFVLEH